MSTQSPFTGVVLTGFGLSGGRTCYPGMRPSEQKVQWCMVEGCLYGIASVIRQSIGW